jgi:hypothetical protein
MRGLFTAFTPWWSTSARPALSSLCATGGCMVIPIQLDANVVTADIARGDKRGTRAAKWIEHGIAAVREGLDERMVEGKGHGAAS